MHHNKRYKEKKEAHAKINNEAEEYGMQWEEMNRFWSYCIDMSTPELLEHWEWKKEVRVEVCE